jgi:hypothetical protein
VTLQAHVRQTAFFPNRSIYSSGITGFTSVFLDSFKVVDSKILNRQPI